jgi:putative heme-binding domain-containing protein
MSHLKRALSSCIAVAALGITSLRAAPSREIEDHLAAFRVAPGFSVNLFASETIGVVKPLQMRWDERGRLWVTCSPMYPMIEPGGKASDFVIVLEDADHDGVADKSTLFADGFNMPAGLELAPGKGANACYVGEGTTLWVVTDDDGDGRADRREAVLRGFGTGDTHQTINSFRWSPFGELMFCQGLNIYSQVETVEGIERLDQAGLWSFHVRSGRLTGFYGGRADPQNPYGWVYTRWGQPIVSAGNSGTMYFPGPELIRGWQGGRRDPVWSRGRGRKTSNPEIIESAHFPDAWQGVLAPGGYIHNSVWSLSIQPDGAGFRLADHPDLPPLIQSRHGSFRPIDVKLGPDGALYILDWYNPIIGHYQVSMRHPDRDKVNGRIWRVTANGRPLLKAPKIADASPEELFELLRAPDRWPREQAKRVLFGGETEVVVPRLLAWTRNLGAQEPELDFALTQAMGVLEAHQFADAELLRRVLTAREPQARALAAPVLARWADRLPADFGVIDHLLRLAVDEDPRVRLAAVVAAGNLPRPDSIRVVLTACEQATDGFIDTAARAAATVLRPQWEPTLESGPAGWKPAWTDRVRSLARPLPAVPANAVAQQVSAAIVPVHGRLRATQYTVGTIAAEVLARGNPVRGEEIYRRPELTCVACHRIGDEGGVIGPALDALGSSQPLEHLIGMVLEPQREIKEGFETFRITTKNGNTVIGTVVAGNAAETTLRDPSGAEHVIAEADVVTRESIGSLMPAGLTDSLSSEDLRDLFAYLEQLGKAK